MCTYKYGYREVYIHIYVCTYVYILSIIIYTSIYVHTHTTTMIKESKAINLRECNKRDWEKENEEGSDIIIL